MRQFNSRKWPLARDIALFVGGLLGVAHETVLSHAERPTLLILYAAMMGLPWFLPPYSAPPQPPPPPVPAKDSTGKEDD